MDPTNNNRTSYEHIQDFDATNFPIDQPLNYSNSYHDPVDNFTNNNFPQYIFGADGMSQYLTPMAMGTGGRGVGLTHDTDNVFVSPYGQQVTSGPSYISYGNGNGMGLQQTPLRSNAYHGSFTEMPAEELAAPVAYNGVKRSFSEETDSYDTKPSVAYTPTPKPRAMPTLPSAPALLPSVSLTTLRFNNFDEAEAEASGRRSLEVDDDDWQAIASNKKHYVAIIMGAFEGPFRTEPNVSLTSAEKVRWVKYQTEQNEKAQKCLSKNPSAKETAAWMLLETLLDVHKLGYKRGLRVVDADKLCSDRFAQMVRAIANYAVIRFDIVRMMRFDELATSPAHVVARKVANWRGNCHKVKRDEKNRQAAAEVGIEYEAVLGAKRKYKPMQPPITESNEDTSGFNSSFDEVRDNKKRRSTFDHVGGDDTPSPTPTKRGRKCATVLTGPDN